MKPSPKQQIARHNHYVPQWYQKGFFAKGQQKLQVLNLDPAPQPVPHDPGRMEPELQMLGPKQAFQEFDLYTTRFGQQLNDEIETHLFGRIDKRGADAVRAWIAGNPVQIHRTFQDFFEYMDAQKLRTPKGLDWIVKHFAGLPHLQLMLQMQALRQMHATMWSECVREIVSAVKSPVKFLVSDHPITIYHPKFSPKDAQCQHPDDPGIELVGSQTLFPLDANHCLILTNLEYAQDFENAPLLSRRTNARFRGDSMARTDALIRGRELSEAEVHAVNLVLKSRAKKYIAASNADWLYPERHCTDEWSALAPILFPKSGLWNFGGETFIGYPDGTTAYRDAFGRTSKAHEFLAKQPSAEDPSVDAPCGCGSGLHFGNCCLGVEPHQRPSWRVMSIRERNLALIRAINRIMDLKEGKTWDDVRRSINDEHVRKIHEVFGALWPTDTRLTELLPRPQSKRSRAVYLGMVDARTLSTTAIGMLPYIDELVLVHPFVNPNGVQPDFSPVVKPAKFREQTLRNVFALMLLEPEIAAGRVHLVPDPLDYDQGFRHEILSFMERRDLDDAELGPRDQLMAQELGKDEFMRSVKRLPPAAMKAYLRRVSREAGNDMSDEVLDGVVEVWKRELEQDPLALLDPPRSGKEAGEFQIYKGFGRETGLFMATLTGAFVYTDSDTQWARLHAPDEVRRPVPDPAASEQVRSINGLLIEVPVATYWLDKEPVNAGLLHDFLRDVSIALRGGTPLPSAPQTLTPISQEATLGDVALLQIRASIPVHGFQRADVSRLVLTFGRTDDVAPARLALLLEPYKAP